MCVPKRMQLSCIKFFILIPPPQVQFDLSNRCRSWYQDMGLCLCAIYLMSCCERQEAGLVGPLT